MRISASAPVTPGPSWTDARALREEATRLYYTNPAGARRIAQRALRVAETVRDPRAMGWAHRAMAESLLFSGRVRESNRHLVRATKAFELAEDTATLAQVLVAQVHVLALLGDARGALRCADRARDLLEEGGDHIYLAKLAMNLGNFHFQRDEPLRALACYAEASAGFGRLGVRDETTIGLEINRGVALTHLDRHREALELFRSTERLTAELGLDVLHALSSMNRAYVHALRAEHDLALEALSAATGFFRQAKHPKFLGSCLLSRAEIYNQLNLHERAIEAAGEAVRLFQRHGPRYDLGLACAELGISWLGANDAARAGWWILKGREIFARERHGSRSSVMDLLQARVLLCRGRRELAERHARRAYDRFQRLGLIRWQAAAAVLLADVAPVRYRKRLTEVLHGLPATRYPVLTLRLWEALGDALVAAGRPAEARRFYERAAGFVRRINLRIPTEDYKLAFVQDKSRVFERLAVLESWRHERALDRLFATVEQAKTLVLGEQIRSPRTFLQPDRVEARLLAELEEERRDLSWLHSRLSRLELAPAEERKRIPGLRRRLLAAERRWALRRTELRERRPGTSRDPLPVDAPGPRVADIQASLPGGWGFLSYFIAAERSFVLAITPERVVQRPLPARSYQRLPVLADHLDLLWEARCLCHTRELSARGSRASGGVSARTADARERLRGRIDATLTELHELLWQPVEATGLAPGAGWIVSPHGAMHRIPLHCLLGPEGHVVEGTSLAVVPGADTWLALARRGRKDGRRAWIAGVRSALLPGVRDEIDRVAGALTGWEISRDLGPTRERFLNEGPRYDLIHVAAHGLVRSDNPAFSYIELADGPLYVHDLWRCRLDGSTVVLTACSSGSGIASAGNEWIGMARGMLKAGAATVMGSLWPIEDRATTELVRRFYAHLAACGSPAQALGAAMRESRKGGFDPWQWAAFTVYGAP